MKKLFTFIIITLLFFAIFGQCEAQSRECVVQAYTSQLGVREATGHNDGADVEKYLSTTGLGKGFAWCAAFVNWAHQQCGYSGPRAAAAWSPAWFPTSKLVTHPQQGDVFGIYFASKKRIAHVGFIDRWEGNKAYTVEGNTNEAGSREGDGVYRKIRLQSQIYKVARWIDTN